jgi:glutamate-1-semialdehyde 2,1-aminomutase
LILDEVATDSVGPGGRQEYYGITPDISTFGKALGAFPVGAVVDRDPSDRMRWSENMVLHYGTFNGYRLTMKVVAANQTCWVGRRVFRNCTTSVMPPSQACAKFFGTAA